MKKVLMFLVLAVSLVACEGPMGPQGEIGPPGYDGRDGKDGKDGSGANWYSRTFTIQPNEWELDGPPDELNSFFYISKDFPQLTQEIFNSKAVIAYVESDKGYKNGMPYVLHKGGTTDNDDQILWTQTMDFDYKAEEITFYLTYSNFYTDRPETPITFYIVLIW